MRFTDTSAFLALLLVACDASPKDQLVAQAKAAVTKDFLDPSSAQLRNMTKQGPCVEGEVNGKNAFGAYTGFKRFAYHSGLNLGAVEPDLRLFKQSSSDEQLATFTIQTEAYTKVLQACINAKSSEVEAL